MNLLDKLTILTDAAKYDASCTSSGVIRGSRPGMIGNTSSSIAGCCHSFSADGRCISLLKVLMTNYCVYDCKYCINRRSNDTRRTAFTPRELAELTVQFYRRNYIEGLFLSSGVLRDPDYTTLRMIETLRLLRREFAFNPGEIDAVILSHAHIDHSGLLPKLIREGFKGFIHCTHVTEELCEILLPDCGHIQESDAEIATRKGLRAGKQAVEPLYTADDAYLALKHFIPHDYDEDIELYPGITFRFRVAGHILGSALVNLMIEENGKKTKLIFTGDIGQPNVPILDDPHQISGADFIITESTYGNRLHEQVDREKELCDVMKEALSRGGNVIIPAFAVGRTQVMLYYFQKLMSSGQLPVVPIMVDSPMAIKATQVMLFNPEEYDEEARTIFKKQGGRLIDMPNVKYTETAAESKAINDMPSPMIIISASGMADAGRVLHHLKHNLWRKDSSVIFAGYQAEGSLGRRLIDGAKKVKIMGEDIAVGAKIYNLTGFSAHADRDQMLAFYKGMERKPR